MKEYFYNEIFINIIQFKRILLENLEKREIFFFRYFGISDLVFYIILADPPGDDRTRVINFNLLKS